MRNMICRRLFQLPTVSMFLVAMATGMILCIIVKNMSLQYLSDTVTLWTEMTHDQLYRKWLQHKGVQKIPGDEYQYVGSKRQVITESKYLLHQVKILCIVMLDTDKTKWQKHVYLTDEYTPTMTSPELAVRLTWGRHCSKVIFFSSVPSLDVPVVQLSDTNDIHSWTAYYEVIMHIAKEFIANYEWFVIVEEDTYLIMENLAYYLAVFNHSTPLYVGHALTSWHTDYNAGGPGIVLNQAALHKLYQRLAKGHCRPRLFAGDLMLAQCLSECGIFPTDSRDSFGRSRFLMYQPELHLVPGFLSQLGTMWSTNKFRMREVMYIFLC